MDQGTSSRPSAAAVSPKFKKRKCQSGKSGNAIVDDFIKYTQINDYDDSKSMEFVPYDQFKDVKFIAEGGFSKIYKATWINGPITEWNDDQLRYNRKAHFTVALKKICISTNITPKDLNELKIFYQLNRKGDGQSYINRYYGITQVPTTKDFMIIMDYCKSGDLKHYIPLNFYNLGWQEKLNRLECVVKGLTVIHSMDIIHRNFHSGNILTDGCSLRIGSLGLSKFVFESSDDDEEIYGVIPYIAPEVLQGQQYNKASDIYSFGMIMWELMTGREPFWDQNHDTDLIIGICDGLRPPIVTNAPEGYVELMKSCWNSHINKRPTIIDIERKVNMMKRAELINKTKIIRSSDIGPIDHGITYNLDAIIKSDKNKRKFDDLAENDYEDNFDNLSDISDLSDMSVKRIK